MNFGINGALIFKQIIFKKHLKSMFKGNVLKLYNMVNVNQKLVQHFEPCEPGTVKFLKIENLIIIKCKVIILNQRFVY